jgi:hypothetical protein
MAGSSNKGYQNKIDWIVATVLVIIFFGCSALQVLSLSDKTTKLETVLFNILQFLLAVGFAWFSTRAIVRGEFEGSLKRFAVSAYRRISDIENIVSNLKSRVADMRAKNTEHDSHDLELIAAIVQDTARIVSSSRADWSDVIGEEMIALENITRLENEKAEIEIPPSTSVTKTDFETRVKQIDQKIEDLVSHLPAPLQYEVRRQENLNKGNLVFDFLDVYGERPDDRVDVTLKHQVLSQSVKVRDQPSTRRLRVTALDSTQGGIFSLQVFPLRRRPVGRFLRVLEGKTVQHSIVLPADADRVTGIAAPPYDSLGADLRRVLESSAVEGDEDKGGADLYGALDDIQKAGMLNIYAKMKATKVANDCDVFSYVTEFTRIRGGRFFAKVAKELWDAIKNSIPTNLFHEVSGALHAPPPGFVLVDSFKSLDLYGSLQLTFFTHPETSELLIEGDIDDAQGVEHIFQVLRPILAGKDTNPYDVHEILLEYQKIDPGYKLLFNGT